jgi:MFS family permease
VAPKEVRSQSRGDRSRHRPRRLLSLKIVVTLSMLCAAALTISIAFLGDPALYPLLLLVLVLDGAMTQAYRPAASAMLADLVPSDRLVMTFSMYRVALNTGAVIGPLADEAV